MMASWFLRAGLLLAAAADPLADARTATGDVEKKRTLSLASLGAEEKPKKRTYTETQFPHVQDGSANSLRFTADLSSRAVLPARRGKVGAQRIVGLDFPKVFTDVDGDIGTLRLQSYMTRIDILGGRPPLFEDDDLEFVFRFFDFNWSRPENGQFNIRVGHFELPFELEHPVDANGELRQLITGENLGLRSDWEISINSTFPTLEYEVALTRGTEN